MILEIWILGVRRGAPPTTQLYGGPVLPNALAEP